MTGIEKIQKTFQSPKKIKLMTHIVAGFPTLADSEEIVKAMAQNGADIVEIQIPFSDPTADGPSISGASTVALAGGINPLQAIDMAGRLASTAGIPILIMTYINPVFSIGIDRFVSLLSEKGISGVIIPDCPFEDDLGLVEKCTKAGLAFVPLVAPGTSSERMKYLSGSTTSPFVYAVTRLGITGKKTNIGEEGIAYLQTVKNVTGKYCAAGFGIREKDQIDTLIGIADCAVVGSAVTDTARNAHNNKKSPAEEVGKFIKELIG
jgi:tryptophan synthase alpha chain